MSDVQWSSPVYRRHTPLMLSYAVSGQTRQRIERWTGLATEFRYQRRDGLAYQFTVDELSSASAAIGARVDREGLAFFEDFADRCQLSCDRLIDAGRAVSGTEANQLEDRLALRDLLRPFFEVASDHAAFLMTVILVQVELEKYLVDAVERAVGSDNAPAVIDALKYPTIKTNEVRNLTAMLELGAYMQRSLDDWQSWPSADPVEVMANLAVLQPDAWQQIQDYVDEYGWMGRMYFAGRNVSPGDVILRLQVVVQRDCQEVLNRTAERERSAIARRNASIKEIGDDGGRLADVLARYLYLRSERLDAFFISFDGARAAIESASKFLELFDDSDVLWLGGDEILRGLKNDSPDRELAKRASMRRPGYTFTSVDAEISWMPVSLGQGDEAVFVDQAPGEIHGTTACVGDAAGTVRVLRNDEDMLDMSVGDILVATMTTPSLMLAVEKAAAIVTDEGGMLCHAAIVSREFGIPCIIGTGVATHQLVTGDRVRVFARRPDEGDGVVKVEGRGLSG